MLQQTRNQFGRQAISSTNVQYSKAQIVGNPENLTMGSPLRLVFKNDNVKMIDVANSSICFSLAISPGALSPMVPCESVADIFSVVSIYWNGIQLNMLQYPDTNMLFRKVANRINGETHHLTQGKNPGYYKVPTLLSTQMIGVAGGTGNLVCAYSSDATGDASLANLVKPDQDEHVAYKERLRLAPSVQRHYTVDTTAGANKIPTYVAKPASNPLGTYSVKLGDICPELLNLQLVQPDMFKGSGLEINLVLLESRLCMQRPPITNIAACALAVANSRDAGDSYSLSNIFLSLVYHQSIDPRLGFMNSVPFMSVYGTKAQMVSQSCNHNFSLNSGCFVRGAVITFNAAQMADGGSARIGQFAVLGTVGNDILTHTTSKLYSHKMAIQDLYLNIGANQYPINQSPPVSNKTAFDYILAVQNSEQIFGRSYSVSLDDFCTKDFCLFIPVNRYVQQGELLQFHCAYNADGNAAEKEANIMIICDRSLEVQSDGTTRIEG